MDLDSKSQRLTGIKLTFFFQTKMSTAERIQLCPSHVLLAWMATKNESKTKDLSRPAAFKAQWSSTVRAFLSSMKVLVSASVDQRPSHNADCSFLICKLIQ